MRALYRSNCSHRSSPRLPCPSLLLTAPHCSSLHPLHVAALQAELARTRELLEAETTAREAAVAELAEMRAAAAEQRREHDFLARALRDERRRVHALRLHDAIANHPSSAIATDHPYRPPACAHTTITPHTLLVRCRYNLRTWSLAFSAGVPRCAPQRENSSIASPTIASRLRTPWRDFRVSRSRCALTYCMRSVMGSHGRSSQLTSGTQPIVTMSVKILK